MRKTGFVLLILGVLFLLLALLPDSLLHSWHLHYGLIGFIHSWTFMIAFYFIFGGGGAIIGCKKHSEKTGRFAH